VRRGTFSPPELDATVDRRLQCQSRRELLGLCRFVRPIIGNQGWRFGPGSFPRAHPENQSSRRLHAR